MRIFDWNIKIKYVSILYEFGLSNPQLYTSFYQIKDRFTGRFEVILNWKITVSKNYSRLMFVFNFNPSIHDHVQAFPENRNYFHYKVFKRLHYNLISKNLIRHRNNVPASHRKAAKNDQIPSRWSILRNYYSNLQIVMDYVTYVDLKRIGSALLMNSDC